MKLKFTLALFIASLFFSQTLYAQTAGDYRSNVTTTGAWEIAANWEVYNGTAWAAAVAFPTSADGKITIQSGDDIELTSALTIDEVIVATGGILSFFKTGGPSTTFTLSDGPGTDLEVNGQFYIGNFGNLTGAGNVMVNAGGIMYVRFTGSRLDVATTIAASAELQLRGGPTFSSTLTNNGTVTWIEGNITMDNATWTNNSLINITSTTNVILFNTTTTGTNLLDNTVTGIINREDPSSYVTINTPFNNTGILRGYGQITLNNVAETNNNGTVAPGNPIGTLQINDDGLEEGMPTVAIRIEDGSGAGVGNDLLTVNGTTNLATVTLTVTENPTTPLGIYTIMTKPDAVFNNTFAAVNLPANYSLIYTPGTNIVQVQKNSFTLPVTWGSFTAVSKNVKSILDWTTLQESNTAHFIIEHSVNNNSFKALGTVAAAGNSSMLVKYSFTHNTPDVNVINYYRLKQVDIDGKWDYSKTVQVRFNSANAVSVLAKPNLVNNVMQLQIQGSEVTVRLLNMSGVMLRSLRLQPGNHTIPITDLPAGVYHLSVYQQGKYLSTERIIKQ